MLIKTIHVKERRQQKTFEVYPNQKEYTFRVGKRIEEDIKVGKLVRYSKNQLLYVTEVIHDCEDEKQFTGKVNRIVKLRRRKIIFLTEEDLEERREERERLAKKQQNIDNHTKKITVLQGTYLTLQDKKFRKLNKPVRFEATKNVQKWVQEGDILYIHYVNKKGNDVYRYVLIQEIVPGFLVTKKRLECEVTIHYYKKTEKGYMKVFLQKNGLPVIPKKKKEVKQKQAPKKKKTKKKADTKNELPLSRKKESEQSWEETMKKEFNHTWTMRKRDSNNTDEKNNE